METNSQRFFKLAQEHIPGGVNSPVRAFNSVGGSPVFFKSGKGALLCDVDGNEYIDYVGSWGPMILGHAYPPVIKAIQQAAERSTSFGAPTEMEIQLASLIKEMVTGIDKIRMVNSGTEACMSAIRLARGFTGKNKIIKFEGCYHGHADAFLVKAGSGVSTLGLQDSPGVPVSVTEDTLIAKFNDIESIIRLIEGNKGEIAAVIVEPVAGNMGCIPPGSQFLTQLRALCTEHQIVLIFDEVMTGFRLAKGGASEFYDVQPDLFAFGKIIGGGLPVGAYGGKEELMNLVSPVGPVYQAGTLSGNPLAMASGFVTLSELNKHESAYPDLEAKGEFLEKGLQNIFGTNKIPVQINRVGSMFSIHFTSKPVTDFDTAKNGDNKSFKKFFHFMLRNGVYLPPSPFEACFISTAHHPEILEKTLRATENAVSELKGG